MTNEQLKELALTFLNYDKDIKEKRRIIDYIHSARKSEIEAMPAGVERATKLLDINHRINADEDFILEMETYRNEAQRDILEILESGQFPFDKEIPFHHTDQTYYDLIWNEDKEIKVSDFYTKL
jgi:hypothetical protein